MATSVLMTTEGTYPYFKGGVSTWCDQLVRSLPDIAFHIFAVVPSPKQPLSFPLAPNIRSCRPFPLWGTELPGRQEALFSRTFSRRMRTTPEAIEARFVPQFQNVVQALLDPAVASERLAESLLALQDYFDQFDYAKTMASEPAWETFLAGCSRHLPETDRPNLEEATTCMRWVVRYLSVLAVTCPKVDIVHASMAGLCGVPGTLSKLRNGSAYLLTEHGIYLRELYLALSRMPFSYRCRKFLHSLNGALVRMNYHYADCLTSLGEFNRKWQVRIGADPRKILFVPNGVDPELFQPRPERRPERITVVTLARIYRLKGIDTLIKAAAIVHERVPEVRFRILGEVADKPYYDLCRRIAAESGVESVIEWGETATPHQAYNEAHVFVLPSVSEGMPYGVLEAMLSGCPVVATDVGNVADMLNGTGILARPKDPQDLARALLTVLEGPDAAQRRAWLAERARIRGLETYTISKSIGKFRELYEVLKPCGEIYQTV